MLCPKLMKHMHTSLTRKIMRSTETNGKRTACTKMTTTQTHIYRESRGSNREKKKIQGE